MNNFREFDAIDFASLKRLLPNIQEFVVSGKR